MSSGIARLVQLLSAGFSNRTQAIENPPLYAHILVKFRPLPQLMPGSLLSEQSYAVNPGTPFRIRVVRAERQDGGLIIRNQTLVNEHRFWGATDDQSKRDHIQEQDLRPLTGCTLRVKQIGDLFIGEVEPGCRCLVERKGITAYLFSRFELDSTGMRTIDRGHDPTTHAQLWGSLAGPFQFERTHDHSDEIPSEWLEALAG